MNKAARAKLSMAASGQGQASGWGQPGDREGRNVPKRCKAALVPQHILGTELGQSSERETEQGGRESTKNLPENLAGLSEKGK